MAGSAPRQLQWARVRTTWHREIHADIMNDLFESEQRRLESEIEAAQVQSRQQERRIGIRVDCI